jgi:6,7-dimethyl-8-ribityllumazine synthase
MLTVEGSKKAPGLKFAIVVSRFNDFVTDRLTAGALDGLKSAGVLGDDVCVLKVPGAFEIPFAAREVAARGQVAAVICLGCLIRGATAHFEYIASACAHGITDAAAATGIPMTFGDALESEDAFFREFGRRVSQQTGQPQPRWAAGAARDGLEALVKAALPPRAREGPPVLLVEEERRDQADRRGFDGPGVRASVHPEPEIKTKSEQQDVDQRTLELTDEPAPERIGSGRR